jgi:hypothetical protein
MFRNSKDTFENKQAEALKLLYLPNKKTYKQTMDGGMVWGGSGGSGMVRGGWGRGRG